MVFVEKILFQNYLNKVFTKNKYSDSILIHKVYLNDIKNNVI